MNGLIYVSSAARIHSKVWFNEWLGSLQLYGPFNSMLMERKVVLYGASGPWLCFKEFRLKWDPNLRRKLSGIFADYSAMKELTLKAQNKNAADDTLIFHFHLSKKIRLDFSCESSA